MEKSTGKRDRERIKENFRERRKKQFINFYNVIGVF